MVCKGSDQLDWHLVFLGMGVIAANLSAGDTVSEGREELIFSGNYWGQRRDTGFDQGGEEGLKLMGRGLGFTN